MNDETRNAFAEIAGYQPGVFATGFQWLLVLSLFIMILILIKNTGDRRTNDSDFNDIDVMTTILRGVALFFILLLIFI